MKFIKLFVSALALIAGLMVSTPGHAQPWTGIIAASRAENWSNAGVVGGIPSGSWAKCATTACTALATPANVTAANINTAIAGAPANTYVLLPAGTFTMNAGLVWNHTSNVVLRGAGSNSTLLTFSSYNSCQGLEAVICFESSDTNYYGSPSNVANWTANYNAAATSITLDSVTNLQVGFPITLDQTDDLSTADTGAIFVCYTPVGVCSTNGDNGGAPRTGRSQQQIVEVTSISGTGPYTVGISPPIVMPNWVAAKTPQAWWPNGPVFYDGVENLSINAGTSGSTEGVGMFNCVNCWETGVASIGAWGRSHTSIFQSSHCTVQNNYFYLTGASATVHYGVETIPASDTLVQNNIFQAVQAPYPSTGTCTGCVYSYNFDVDLLFGTAPNTWQNQSGFPHAVGDEHILYEGNIGAGIYSDNFHGTHQFQTIFRNYWNGYEKDNGYFTTGDTSPLIIDAYSRFYNIIGNVLGNAAVQNSYEDTVTDPHSGTVPIYSVGYGDEIPNDSNTATTLMRWGNYDVVTNTARFVSTEVPSGLTGTQAPFANPVPANNTLPPSFYLTAQPSWWTSGKQWPSIGPDVTGGDVQYCVGGTYTGTYVLSSAQCPGGTATTLASGHIISNPAMDCYLNTMAGPPDGLGAALSFNANACYPVGSIQPPPAAPTNLTVVLQ
jgi:hypothetical protein